MPSGLFSITSKFTESREKTMSTDQASSTTSRASHCSSVLFVIDSNAGVVKLQDGSEIPAGIIESIETVADVDELGQPFSHEYKMPGKQPLDAIIHIRHGWTWGGKQKIRVSDYCIL